MESNIEKRNVTTAVLKVLSIYAFVQAIDNFAHKFQFLFNIGYSESNTLVIIQVIIPPLLLIIGGIILWMMSPFLASLICRSRELDEKPQVLSEDIQIIVFSSIGIFILATALPEIVQTMIVYYGAYAFSLSDRVAVARSNGLLFSSILKILIGLWLLFGSRGIAKLLRLARRD